MNHWSLQQNAFATHDEMRGSVQCLDRVDCSVVCPKPRRIGRSSTHSQRPFRLQLSNQSEICDAKAGAELMDLLMKEGYGAEQSVTHSLSSPPFFCGSPPSRVSNPIVQDAQFCRSPPSRAANPIIQDVLFGDDRPTPFSALTISSPSNLSSPSSARKGGCARPNFGHKPAVRIEGFDCLSRDRQNSRIPAVA
ncbi:hypothetical protein RJ641_006537 [Dillenia turbinata]|uniref:Uncharacterized protein n=1 Tax=Dillenia turbinata TaxID=194707 RepID=A0AAN8Z7N2_9MAGN